MEFTENAPQIRRKYLIFYVEFWVVVPRGGTGLISILTGAPL